MPKRPAPSKSLSKKPIDPDWRADILNRIRALIARAAPDAIEEVKWRKPSNNMRGVPVWSHPDVSGKLAIICTGETYKAAVKLTFPHGAAIPDPARLFNASLEGTRRAIDLHEGDTLNDKAFIALIRAAIATSTPPSSKPKRSAQPKAPRLLSGGNPQIAKGEGDAPVRAYIDAMPDWKRDVGRRVDAIIQRAVPNVRKAVKWNSPLYGIRGQGWFVALHCYTKFVRLTFFNGTSLDPMPPGPSKTKAARHLDIHEGELGHDLRESQLAAWFKQASALPGWGSD